MKLLRLLALLGVCNIGLVPCWSQENPTAEAEPVTKVATEISQPPLSEVIIPPGRPAWVESAAARSGRIQQTAVKSEPFVRRADCERALDKEITAAVSDYIEEQTGSKYAPTLISYDLNAIKRRLVTTNRYEETIVSPSVGEMHQIHALVQFPEDFRAEIAQRWLQVRSASRLGQVGLAFAAILSVLGTVFGFFRADNATRGYYTGRLQFVAGVAILTMFLAGAMFARWIPWI